MKSLPLKKSPHPLNRAEIVLIFYLALLVSIIEIMSLVKILNIFPQEFYEESFLIIMDSHWHLLIILSLYIFPSIVNNLLVFWRNVNYRAQIPFWFQIIKQFFFWFSIILVIMYIVVVSNSSFRIIGIDKLSFFEYLDLFLYGLLIWLVIGLIIQIISRYSRKDDYWSRIEDDIYVLFRCETQFQRLITALVVPIAVVSEEMLFRGFLIIYLGRIYNSMLFFGIISIVLSVTSHLYQGKTLIMNNFVFSIVLVVITIITGKILLATIIHLINNNIVVFSRWRIENKKSYRLK